MKIVNIFLILLLAILGAMIWQTLVFPYLAQNPKFERFFLAKLLNQQQVNVFPKEEIVIEENKDLIEKISKAEKVVLGVQIDSVSGKSFQGSGLALTSDGLIVTLAELVPQSSVFSVFINQKKVAFEIVKKDLKQNLALIRIDKKDLATTGFADFNKVKNGQRVFLVGTAFFEGEPKKISNEGIIRYFEKDFISTNIFEKPNLAGSILFDTDGNVLGINTIESDGRVFAIPVSKIQEFAELK